MGRRPLRASSLLITAPALFFGVALIACGVDVEETSLSPRPTEDRTAPTARATSDSEDASPGQISTGVAQLVYNLPDGSLFRVVVAEGTAPESLDAALDELSPGMMDEWINVAPDGSFYVVSTERFGCDGWACLVVVEGDLSAAGAVLVGGEQTHSDGYGAIASGGDRIVYVNSGGPHQTDLWLLERTASDDWSGPTLLTESSNYAWNSQPAFSDDGNAVVFDCGDVAYGQEGSAICEVDVAAPAVEVVITPRDGPGGTAADALHQPDYAPDGSIMFEATWQGGERLWRIADRQSAPTLITLDPNGTGNSPCALPDGSVSDLWLERPNGSGEHEIRITDPSSGTSFMLITDIDVHDGGYGCGTAPWATVTRPDNSGGASASPTSPPGVTTGLRCQVFPADNPWNTPIADLPADPNSDRYIEAIGRDEPLHPDFGTDYEEGPIGIPYVVVGGDQPRVPVSFLYDEESDPGPYPIPPDAPVEGGPDADGDRHVLVVDDENCVLYELFAAYPVDGGASWEADSGAMFDLNSNALRPDFFTSADAAGLPVFAGLVRYDEVIELGVIDHAVRFTVERSGRGFIHPATHFASDEADQRLPPMGLRLRLKADFDCSRFTDEVQVICTALKTYGMILADNGSNWYISGTHDDRWDDEALSDLSEITGDAFEVVDTGESVVTD